MQAGTRKHLKVSFYESLRWAYDLCECSNVYVILSQKKDAEVVAGQARGPTRRFMDSVEQDVKLADVRDEHTEDLVKLRHMISCGRHWNSHPLEK